MNYFIEKDEIDLADYLKIIVQRKRTFLVIGIFILLAGLSAYILTPYVYEARTVILIGGISKPMLSYGRSHKEVLDFVNSEGFFRRFNLTQKKGQLNKVLRFEDLNYHPLIDIKIILADPELAMRLSNTIANEFVGHWNEIYYSKINLIEDEMMLESKKKYSLIDEIKIAILESKIACSYPFRVVSPAVLPTLPIQSQKIKNTLLFIFSGLVFVLLVVSFLELSEKNLFK